jgi:hypothetical protein
MREPASELPIADPPANGSSPVRTIISLLIFIHLFGVSLAMLSYTAASPVEQRILQILPYLKALDIDPIHTYPSLARWHLTHSMPTDVDYAVEVTAIKSDGGSQTINIPPPGIWPAQRLRRYQSLANVMGNFVENEEYESLLPKAVAGSILRRAGSKRGTIRIIAHDLPTMEDLQSGRPERRDANSSTYRRRVYEAQVLVGDNGAVNLLKASAAGEVAPVERRGGRPDGGIKPTQPDGAGKAGAGP